MKNFNYATPLELLSLIQANTCHDDKGTTAKKLGYGVVISGEENVHNEEEPQG